MYAAIGAWRDDDLGENSGSVYTYQLDRGALRFQAKILATDGAEFDAFGRSVALGASGNTVLGVFEPLCRS